MYKSIGTEIKCLGSNSIKAAEFSSDSVIAMTGKYMLDLRLRTTVTCQVAVNEWGLPSHPVAPQILTQ